MLPLNIRTRLVAAFCAMVVSSTLLGAVVFGMQSSFDEHDTAVLVLERTKDSAPVMN